MGVLDFYTKEEFEKIIENSSCIRDAIQRLGYSTKGGSNFKTVKNKIEEYGIDTSHFKRHKSSERRCEENIFVENSTASQKTLRYWYKKGCYTEYSCSICGMLPFWNGKELTLILDHINGVNNDDRLDNIRWVCPNCNQQLETTGHTKFHAKANREKKVFYCKCGKVISSRSKKCMACENIERRREPPVSKDELLKLIKTESFVKIGVKYNVTDNAVRKWCKKYGLPFKAKDIKKIK